MRRPYVFAFFLIFATSVSADDRAHSSAWSNFTDFVRDAVAYVLPNGGPAGIAGYIVPSGVTDTDESEEGVSEASPHDRD